MENTSKNHTSRWRWGFLGLAILSTLGLLYRRFRGVLLALTMPKAATIGIIGGADGPTAIFVTSKFSPTLMGILSLMGLIVGIVGFILTGKRKK